MNFTRLNEGLFSELHPMQFGTSALSQSDGLAAASLVYH